MTVYRGRVVKVTADALFIELAGRPDSFYGPCELVPGMTLAVGDTVLCDYLAGTTQLEVLRKAVTPTVVTPGTYLSTYTETY